MFKTVDVLLNPRTRSFWSNQRHRLALAPYFVTRYRSPREFRAIRGRISELIQEKKPDLIYADLLPAAQYILDLNGPPRVVDATDALSLFYRRAAVRADSRLEKLRLLLEGRSIRRFEVATASLVDAFLVCSRVDQDTLQGYDRDMNVRCIPNGVDMEYFAPDPQVSGAKSVVFTGVMGYPPNGDAARFFCKEIFPRVREAIPEAEAQLVGSDPPEDVRALAGNGVSVTGAVPDVRPYMHRAAVYVSPLRFGTGVKNKILAALAMGKAVVATSVSCEGLNVKPGEHLLVADHPEDFVAHIVRLFAQPELRYQLGLRGRTLVLERYGWNVMGQRLESLLERIVAQKRGRVPKSSCT